MKRVFVVLIIMLLLTVNVISILSENSESAEIDHVYVGSSPVIDHTFEMGNGGGQDFDLFNVSIRNGVTVSDAYFNLTASANAGGEYPYNLRMNIEGDSFNIYEFIGLGYGAMGEQDVFADNTTRNQYVFQTGGSDDTVKMILPKEATIQSAEITATGNFFQVVDKNVITNNQNNIGEIHPADLDNDGDTDVVVAGNGELVWYNNTNGIGTSWLEHKINASESNSVSVYVFDIDSDGDMDVVSGSRSGGWGSGPINYYRNMDGKGRTWNYTNVNSTMPMHYNLEAADMDNDGDGDIVVASNHWQATYPGLWWFNNTDGNGTNWSQHLISPSTYNGIRSLYITDIDNDGDNDTVFTKYYGGRWVGWFENLDGKATQWSTAHMIRTINNVNLWNLAGGDVNGDGDVDLAVATSTDVRYLQQPSNPMNIWPSYIVGSYTAWWNSDVAIGDLGNPGMEPDGKLDIVVVTYANDDDVIWYRNDGTPAAGNWESHYINANHVDAVSVKIAEMDNKGYIDIVVGSAAIASTDDVVWYKTNGSFPTNVELDLGGDSSNEWTYNSGYFNTTVNINNLASALNALLASEPISSSDLFGNDFVEIDFKVTTATGGRVLLNNLKVDYDYKVKVDGSTDRSFAYALNQNIAPQAPGNDSIPILVSASTGGQLKIDDIVIVYNDYPKALPFDDFALDEDSINETLIDLSQYFTDDYIDPSMLIYEVVDYTQSTFIDVKINPDQKTYLLVDADTKVESTNWFGTTTVTVKAIDDMGLETESGPITIEVRPINDEPERGSKKIPDISLNEGSKSSGIDLSASEYFVDIDSVDLYYDVIVDPFNEQPNNKINATINSVNNQLSVEAYDNYFTQQGNDVKLRVFCDDDVVDINQSQANWDISVTVINLDDDSPQWLPIPDVLMKEDTPKNDAFNIYTYVTDVDNSKDDLVFSILHVTESKVQVDIDNQANLDITSDENFFGSARVDIRASDGTNVGVTSFNVIIENVNDVPEVELLSPRNNAIIFSDSVELRWYGKDVDPGETENLTYKIYFDDISGNEEPPRELTHTGSNITITGLTDKSVYYWRVEPFDGTQYGVCVTIPCPLQFSIDIGSKPTSKLKLPGDEAQTNLDYIVLLWEGSGESGYTISYDVYVSTSSFDIPPPSWARVGKGLTETEFLVENLSAQQTYYWTVIPFTAKGRGSCDSGIWSFMYDPSVSPYEFIIEAPPILEIPKGETVSTAIRFKNTGANPDILIPDINSGTLKFVTELEGTGKEHRVAKDGTLILILNITAANIPVDTYEIIISAESLGGQDTESATITVRIIEEKEEAKGIAQVYLITIPLIIVIIVIVMIFLMISRKKKIEEEKKRVEAELLKPLPSQMLEASDVQYYPGLGVAGGPAQLPSVTLPGGVPPGQPPQAAGQPYGVQPQQLPQLPPAMDPTVAPYVPGAVAPPIQPQPQPGAYPPQQQDLQYHPPGHLQPEPQQVPTQPQVQTRPQEQPQYPPQQPAKTGMPPEQIPYEPKVQMPGEETPVDPSGQAPEQQAGMPEGTQDLAGISAGKLTESLKSKYIQGGVTEETYMSLKKELKDNIDAGATPDSIDDTIKRFIQGQISEDEFKQARA